jgi:hypothetical protein
MIERIEEDDHKGERNPVIYGAEARTRLPRKLRKMTAETGLCG